MKKLTISMKTKIEGTTQTTDFKVKSPSTAKKVLSIIDSMDEVLPILSHSTDIDNQYMIGDKKLKVKKLKSVLNKIINSDTSDNKKKSPKAKKEPKSVKGKKKKESDKKKKSETKNEKKASNKPVRVRRK